MAVDLNNLTPAEQVAAGAGIVLGSYALVRFGPQLVVSLAGTAATKFLVRKIVGTSAKKTAGFIVSDLAIGKLPILDPQNKVTKGGIIVTAFTVVWWMLGVGDAAREAGRHMGIVKGPPKQVPDFAFDELPGSYSPMRSLNSPQGGIQALYLDPTVIDP